MEETKKRNQYEFDKRKYDHIHLQVPKGEKEVIQAVARLHGESLNGFVTKAIDERMERLRMEDTRPQAGGSPLDALRRIAGGAARAGIATDEGDA